jgi:hypothetical protein
VQVAKCPKDLKRIYARSSHILYKSVRVVLILAKMSTTKCPLKANGGGGLSYACISTSSQIIPHLHTLSARGCTAWWQKLSCAGQPVGTQTAISGLSPVIPVPAPPGPGWPLWALGRHCVWRLGEKGAGGVCAGAGAPLGPCRLWLADRGSQLPATGSSRPPGQQARMW